MAHLRPARSAWRRLESSGRPSGQLVQRVMPGHTAGLAAFVGDGRRGGRRRKRRGAGSVDGDQGNETVLPAKCRPGQAGPLPWPTPFQDLIQDLRQDLLPASLSRQLFKPGNFPPFVRELKRGCREGSCSALPEPRSRIPATAKRRHDKS